MPSATTREYDVPSVSALDRLFQEALDKAQMIKSTTTIEPALNESDFEDLITQLPNGPASDPERSQVFAVPETAARRLFNSTVATTPIDSPDFVRIWNLFDILSFLSDHGKCDPALMLWLVEELLDSQTIEGCRKVFDYLESRRERIRAKNFKQKSLVFLRFSNDLMRRLSRAKDATFCGRLYIFISLTFPLHDRSSVNLRGEYHVENETTYEDTRQKLQEASEKMDVDSTDAEKSDGKDKEQAKSTPTAKAVSFDAKEKSKSDQAFDADALYPVFWSLQHYFSQPLSLFDPAQFSLFKDGMGATMTAFETVDKLQKTTKSLDESKLIPQKRRSPESAEERDGSNYNPKYLTSRDLFELEISDLYFRRHILIQALIIIEFLLSLTPQARTKFADVQQLNKSVVYGDHVLQEEDSKWAQSMKEKITSYLQGGPDGYFFFRVVESVLSRDKGWARWKIETCPVIERDAVSPAEFSESMDSARRLATNKRLRPTPMGSLSLNFMTEDPADAALDKLKEPARWQLPELAEFKDKIATDDLELDFAKNEKEKSEILEAKASKTWRALRIARRNKLWAFDKVDDWQNVDAIFQDKPDPADEEEEDEGNKGRRPEDSRPIILSGPSGVGKKSLTNMLLERQKQIFGNVVQHTTRSPRDGEVEGKDFYFVDSKAFNTIVDGDYFLEFSTRDGHDYGTNRRVAEGVSESGKIPVIQLDAEGTQTAKDNGFTARVVRISPPSVDELEVRLKAANDSGAAYSDDRIQEILRGEREHESTTELVNYDVVITNGANVEDTYKALEAFIYGDAAGEAEKAVDEGAERQEDVGMPDINGVSTQEANTTEELGGGEGHVNVVGEGATEQKEEDVAMHEADTNGNNNSNGTTDDTAATAANGNDGPALEGEANAAEAGAEATQVAEG